MTTAAQRLRQKLLDLAIRGKLVPQNPKDEPAGKLLARMREEKSHAEAQSRRGRGRSPSAPHGRATSMKSSPPIPDDEKLFDIPPTWIWCRLGEIGSWGAGATPSRKCAAYYEGGTFPWLKTGDLNDALVSSVPEFVTEKALTETSLHLNPIGSVLIAMYGATIGKVGILGIEATTNQACCACQVADCVDNKYLFYYLLSQRFHLKALGGGGAQPNISKDILVSYPIPLPPLAEQKRIVAALDELLKAADAVATGMVKIATLKDRARAKILDLAIRGKLVEQNAEDEPAEKLLARIRRGEFGHGERGEHGEKIGHVEVERCRKGRATSMKSPPPITDDEKPFDIPQGWAWCRFRELGVITGGHTPSMANQDFWDGDVLWVSSKDMKSKYISNTGKKITKLGAAELTLLKPGAVLMCTRSGILRRTFPVALAAHELTINQDQRAISPHLSEMSEYIYTVLKAMEPLILRDYRKTGTTVESVIWEKFINMPIPLPPLAEQNRIVAKVDEMLAACDNLASEA